MSTFQLLQQTESSLDDEPEGNYPFTHSTTPITGQRENNSRSLNSVIERSEMIVNHADQKQRRVNLFFFLTLFGLAVLFAGVFLARVFLI